MSSPWIPACAGMTKQARKVHQPETGEEPYSLLGAETWAPCDHTGPRLGSGTRRRTLNEVQKYGERSVKVGFFCFALRHKSHKEFEFKLLRAFV